MRGHSGQVNALMVAAKSGWCASAGQDGNVYLWDLGVPLQDSGSQQEHKARITAAVSAGEIGCIATGSDDHTVRIWKNTAGADCQVLHGHLGPITCLTFVNDRQLLVSGSADRTLKVWSLADGKLQQTLGNHWAAAAPAPGQTATPKSKDEAAIRELRKASGHRGAVLGVAAINRSEVVSVGRDGGLRIWNIDTKQETVLFNGGDGPLHTVVADGSRGFIATAGASNRVLRWRPAAGSKSQLVIEHQAPVTALALDGDYLVSASRDKNIGLYNLHASSQSVKLLRGHRDLVTAVAIHAGTKRILSGDAHGNVGLWNVETGKLTGKLDGHRASIRHIKFVADGQRAYTVSADGHLICWDLAAGRRLASFYCPGQITSFALMPDALCLGTSSGGLMLLQLEDGQPASKQMETPSPQPSAPQSASPQHVPNKAEAPQPTPSQPAPSPQPTPPPMASRPTSSVESATEQPGSLLSLLIRQQVEVDYEVCPLDNSTSPLVRHGIFIFGNSESIKRLNIDVGGYCDQCAAPRCAKHSLYLGLSVAALREAGHTSLLPEGNILQEAQAMTGRPLDMAFVLGCRVCRGFYNTSRGIRQIIMA